MESPGINSTCVSPATRLLSCFRQFCRTPGEGLSSFFWFVAVCSSSSRATEAKRANRQRVRVGGKDSALRTLADGHMQPVFLLMAKLENYKKIK
jgi:hypothetical protein